jgi:hypothetical protein
MNENVKTPSKDLGTLLWTGAIVAVIALGIGGYQLYRIRNPIYSTMRASQVIPYDDGLLFVLHGGDSHLLLVGFDGKIRKDIVDPTDGVRLLSMTKDALWLSSLDGPPYQRSRNNLSKKIEVGPAIANHSILQRGYQFWGSTNGDPVLKAKDNKTYRVSTHGITPIDSQQVHQLPPRYHIKGWGVKLGKISVPEPKAKDGHFLATSLGLVLPVVVYDWDHQNALRFPGSSDLMVASKDIMGPDGIDLISRVKIDGTIVWIKSSRAWLGPDVLKGRPIYRVVWAGFGTEGLYAVVEAERFFHTEAKGNRSEHAFRLVVVSPDNGLEKERREIVVGK